MTQLHMAVLPVFVNENRLKLLSWIRVRCLWPKLARCCLPLLCVVNENSRVGFVRSLLMKVTALLVMSVLTMPFRLARLWIPLSVILTVNSGCRFTSRVTVHSAWLLCEITSVFGEWLYLGVTLCVVLALRPWVTTYLWLVLNPGCPTVRRQSAWLLGENIGVALAVLPVWARPLGLCELLIGVRKRLRPAD